MNKREFYKLLEEAKEEMEISIEEMQGDISTVEEILKSKPTMKQIKEDYIEIYEEITGEILNDE